MSIRDTVDGMLCISPFVDLWAQLLSDISGRLRRSSVGQILKVFNDLGDVYQTT